MDYKKLPTVYQDEKIEDYRKFKFRLDDRIKFITENVKPQSQVLDCGSFLGYISNEISKKDCSVVGIEANHLLVKEAQNKFPQIKFICGDVMNLRKHFNRRKFDYVIAGEIVEHLINPDIWFQNVRYVLKPRGKIILTTQNSNGIQFRIRMLLGKFRWDFDHFRLYSTTEIKEQVSKNNFKILKIKIIPVSKIGENQILRLGAYYLGRLFPSLAWTTGIVAQKKYAN